MKPNPEIMSPCVLGLGLIALKAYHHNFVDFNRGNGNADD